MNSGTLLAGTDGLTCMSCGTRTMPPIGVASRMKLKLRFGNRWGLIAALLPAISSV
jgi:hypothetical protein